MSESKRKFTVIDAVIILIAAAVAAFSAYKIIPSILNPSGTEHITFTVMLQQQDQNFADAVHEGDKVTISLTEKDGGIVKSTRSEPERRLPSTVWTAFTHTKRWKARPTYTLRLRLTSRRTILLLKRAAHR